MLIEDIALERRCRSLVEALPLPSPFSVQALVQSVADQAGCVIDLRPLDDDVDPGVTAFIVATSSGFSIHHCVDDDPWRTLTFVAHEVGHLLCGHVRDDDVVDVRPEQDGQDRAMPVEALLPSMVGAKEAWGGRLFRCHLNGAREQEAELLATLLVERIEEVRPDGATPAAAASPTLARYARVLEGTRSRRARR